MKIVHKLAGLGAALGFALFTGSAVGTPIELDQWYTFGFAGAGGSDPLVSGVGYVLGIRSIAAPEPAWTFDCPADHCKIIVTDGFLAIDRFELFDFGVSLGLTSAPSGDAQHTCGNDELACLADAEMGHGVFYVGQGAHSITGLHVAGIPGAGFLRVAVPEPGTLLLIGAGMLMALGLRRRA